MASVMSNPETYAVGAVINHMCSSSGPNQVLQYGLYFNASVPHSLGYLQNLISNAVLNTALSGHGSVAITTINNPVGM
jgi:hypothetical protein